MRLSLSAPTKLSFKRPRKPSSTTMSSMKFQSNCKSIRKIMEKISIRLKKINPLPFKQQDNTNRLRISKARSKLLMFNLYFRKDLSMPGKSR